MKHDLRHLEIDLMRLLHDELPPERARGLRERLAREPALAASFQRTAGAWEGLTLPPAAAVPYGFTGRVMAEVRGQAAAGLAAGTLSWSAAPRWVRAAGAAALLAGALLGAGLGHGMAGDRDAPAGAPGLTESYWAMVDESAATTPVLPSTPRGEARR
jgi:anti-sigma factor RsiW